MVARFGVVGIEEWVVGSGGLELRDPVPEGVLLIEVAYVGHDECDDVGKREAEVFRIGKGMGSGCYGGKRNRKRELSSHIICMVTSHRQTRHT